MNNITVTSLFDDGGMPVLGYLGCKVYLYCGKRAYRQKDLLKKLLKRGGILKCEEFLEQTRGKPVGLTSSLIYVYEENILGACDAQK